MMSDDMEYEPNWDDYKEVRCACGHTGLIDCQVYDPGPGELCWGCQPCSDCGKRMSLCACPAVDPFAEERK